jgi:Protein of unknown function (DUF3604)
LDWAVDENLFLGHGGAGLPAGEAIPPGLPDLPQYNPGGLAVLWAEENSRGALFAAMRRREAYATSGPRIVVRFFGGWDYDPEVCTTGDVAAAGYASGVPMGGTLSPPQTPPTGDAQDARVAPVFMVNALRDSSGPHQGSGMPLERIQIIKSTVDGAGEPVTRVIDVAEDSGDAGVDPATCEIRGTGATQLCAVWRDESFKPEERAVYYARVLEHPVCRWSQRQCVAAGVDCAKPETIGTGYEGCCAANHQKTIQERAWTSPIWYSPVTASGETDDGS